MKINKVTKIRFILLTSFLLVMFSVYQYQTMMHNVDLAYNYQKLQADGLLPRANYADRAVPLFGDIDKKYTLNYLYTQSFKWQRIYLTYIIMGTMIFSYGLSYIRKDYKDEKIN